MKYAFIGFLRIPAHLLCGVVTRHKVKDKAEWMSVEGSDVRYLVETCSLCGAQRVIDKVAQRNLVQLA